MTDRTQSRPVILRHATAVTMNSSGEIVSDSTILIEGNRIARIFRPGEPTPDTPRAEVVDLTGKIVVPGFVQTHVHLCQTLFRGRAENLELLDWLRDRIFPFEAAHNALSMYASALMGAAELIRSGTTTILDMGSIHHEEDIIRAIGDSGLRAFVGKSMMDINELYPSLRESAADSLTTTRDLAERWHNSFDGRIRYAAAPRFVLSCSDRLLRDTAELVGHFPGMLLHTHASENRSEIRAVRERCRMENIEFLDHVGLLSPRSVLAHCIHINSHEIDLLKDTGASISHCPSSNLKLGSGIADVPAYLERKVTVTLGADGAPCNNSLNMFQEMRLASLLQKPHHGPKAMPAKTVLEMATREGAKALGLGDEIGTLEKGKKADLLVLDLNNVWDSTAGQDDPYAAIVYSAEPRNVEAVMIDGEWVYRDREYLTLDPEAVRADALTQLGKLLSRLPTHR
jgi:5-methylthioadenosine/S-adenosylhomocysteine deaminase